MARFTQTSQGQTSENRGFVSFCRLLSAEQVFVNGGERSLTHSAQVMYIAGSAIRAASLHGDAAVKASAWAMKKSVEIK